MSRSVTLKTETTGLKGELFLEDLLKQCEAKESIKNAAISLQVNELSKQANSDLLASQIPTKRDEEWRFLDLSELQQTAFKVAEKRSVSAGDLEAFRFSETQQSQIVFVNGFYAPELSNVSGLKDGVYVGSLVDLPAAQAEKITKYLGRQEDSAEVFTALNTFGLSDAAVIWVHLNVVVETPIHVLFLSAPASIPSVSQPRLLVVAETGASLELIEDYAVLGQNTPYFTNAVAEIWVQDNAEVKHNRIQQESQDGFHIAKTAIAQARDSRYTCNEINLGGKLYRNTLKIFQKGEQTATNLNGLVAISDEQVSDTHSAILLTKPYGTTDQLHKCIIDGNAQAVFNGKVFVPKAAQQTNATQLNRNLLLSPKARVNTKPELQITADQVKCAHGATVSQLEADELFYLRSRGLTEIDARYLLVDAFAAEILDRISINSLRAKLTQFIARKVKN
jgi:Fe-S cluster assembly protein SufD